MCLGRGPSTALSFSSLLLSLPLSSRFSLVPPVLFQGSTTPKHRKDLLAGSLVWVVSAESAEVCDYDNSTKKCVRG